MTKLVPQYVSGSADLHGSNKNYINGGNNFGNPKIKGKSFAGRNFYFGIREHAMGTMVSHSVSQLFDAFTSPSLLIIVHFEAAMKLRL